MRHATIKADALHPLPHVGLRDVTPYHTLEINYEVERYTVDIVCVGYDDVLSP